MTHGLHTARVSQSVVPVAELANSVLEVISALPPYLDEIIGIVLEALRSYLSKCSSMVRGA